MTELGTRLKEARTSKGYSLDDLQEITKIQKRYLAGIEDGNFTMMPGSFYVRAFIKQYAEAVDLNADEIFETYQHEIPGSTPTNVVQSMAQTPTRRKISGRNTGRLLEYMPKIIVALFIIVAIVTIWILNQNRPNSDEKTNDNTNKPIEYQKTPSSNTPDSGSNDTKKEEEKAPEEPKKEEPPAPKQAISAGTIGSDGRTTTYTLTGAKEMKLRVESSGDSWIGVTDEKGKEISPKARVYKAGEKVELDASTAQYIRIRIGAAKNIKVFVNDELVNYTIPPENKSTQNIIINFSKEQ